MHDRTRKTPKTTRAGLMTDPWEDIRERHQKDAEAFAKKRLAAKDDPLQRVLDTDRLLADADALLAVVRAFRYIGGASFAHEQIVRQRDAMDLLTALPEHLK